MSLSITPDRVSPSHNYTPTAFSPHLVFPLHTIIESVPVPYLAAPYSLGQRLYDREAYHSAWHMYEIQVVRWRTACIIN